MHSLIKILKTPLSIIFLTTLFLGAFAQHPYPNLDLSEESFSDWKMYRGSQQGEQGGRTINYIDISTNGNSVPGNAVQLIYPPTNPRAKHEDPNTCYNILKVPKGKTHCLRVGPLSPGGYGDPQGYKAAYTLEVVPERATLIYRFAFVQQHDHGSAGSDDPFGFGGGASGAGNNAQFWMQFLNENGDQIGGSCANYRLYPGAGEQVEWFEWNSCGEINNTPWITDVIDLTPFVGQKVTIEFNTMDCYTGHHMAYAYVSPETFTSDTTTHYCPGQMAVVEAPRGFKTYYWEQIGGDFQITKENSALIGHDLPDVHTLEIENPVAYAKYRCTFTSYSGCEGQITYTLDPDSVKADFIFKESPDVCREILFTDSSKTDSGLTIVDWKWDFGDFLKESSTATTQNSNYTYSIDSLYKVKLVVTNDSGCQDSLERTVLIQKEKAYFTSSAQTVCEKEEVTFSNQSLGQDSIQTYYWLINNTTLEAFTPTAQIFDSYGDYPITLVTHSFQNCYDTLTEVLSVKPNQLITNLNFSEACVETNLEKANYTEIHPDEETLTTVDWDFGNGDKKQTATLLPNYSYSVEGLQNIRLITKSAFGCVDTLRSSVMVNPIPQGVITADTLEGCPPLCVTFGVNTSLSSGYINLYLWTFEESVSSSEQNPAYCFNSSGTPTIKVELTTDKGCKSIINADLPIEVWPVPEVDFKFSPNPAYISDPVIYFENLSFGATSYLWDLGNGITEQVSDPIQDYQVSGDYPVKLIGKNEYTCSDSAEHTVTIDSIYAVNAPTAFTPNGDGVNDTWGITNSFAFPELEVTVYNRWGNIVFRSNGYGKAWDGRDQSTGNVLPMGTYYYTIDLKSIHGHKPLEGTITILK